VLPKVRQPILILQGERDAQVPPHHADKLAELARSRRKTGAEDVQVVKVPGVNHLLVQAETGEVSEYGRLGERRVDEAIAKAIVDFLGRNMDGR
jgi:pimeloyl-ACP methyl ester carboxylesterase